ncbi:MAG: glycosyltransferase family 4 protein [Candidatus Pelagadaptatus aseana]|uniref:glycosyltransferase family 4 protein n=1 Tax=Candidatus Pelagadaptatus aseana TaxID=3120508 RepID=UPI0039B1EA08
MKLAFALYKYFPYGGLQRDLLRIAEACHKRGCDIRVYTFGWQGDIPDWIDVQLIGKKGFSSHKKNRHFLESVQRHIQQHPVDALIGFNKMPGLDIYYAADGCYEARVTELYGNVYRMGGRYKHFSAYENAVFGVESSTQVLMISALQMPIFQQYYDTPDERMHLLPPGIARDRVAPDDADAIRQQFRDEFNIADDERLLLMVGSGFKTKGVDRAVNAMAQLPTEVRDKTRLFVIGQDNPKGVVKQAKKLGLGDRFQVFAGRDDIPRFMMGSDLLVHPARHENTGTVLLEALVAGLPVLVTDVCGYAHYVKDADMGVVMPSPFSEGMLAANMKFLLSADDDQRHIWRKRSKVFAQQADIYSMPETAAEKIIEIARAKQ